MILIVSEHANGKLSKSTYEMAEAARNCGREGPVTLLVLGSNVAAVATQAALLGDQVLVADLPALAEYDPEVWAAAVAQIASEGEAHTTLIGGSRSGREYSPRVAVKLDAPLIEDAISLKASGDALQAEHYTFLARVTECVEAAGPVVVVTIKPGAFSPAKPNATAAEQYDVELNLPTLRVTVTGRITEKSERWRTQISSSRVAGVWEARKDLWNWLKALRISLARLLAQLVLWLTLVGGRTRSRLGRPVRRCSRRLTLRLGFRVRYNISPAWARAR